MAQSAGRTESFIQVPIAIDTSALDWGPDQIVGRWEVEAAGGRVVSIPLEPGTP